MKASHFLQVNLLHPYQVMELATQGRQDFDQWVTAYKVACSMDGDNFSTVKDTTTGLDKVNDLYDSVNRRCIYTCYLSLWI